MTIRLLITGGTIDKVYFDDMSDYQVGEPEIGKILHAMNVGFDFRVNALMRKDSLHLTDKDRHAIYAVADSCEACCVLITHGTDSMVETARVLRRIKDKTIVLTGALQPAAFYQTDAIFNIGCAIGAVQSKPPGVYIAMNGQVFDPCTTRKNIELNRFEGI